MLFRWIALAAVLATLPDRLMAMQKVDIELVLAVDVSGSVDGVEQDLQRRGLSGAFRDVAVIDAITALPDGLAVALVAWAGVDEQRTLIAWHRLTDAASAMQFADLIDGALPVELGSSPYTALGDALIWSLAELARNGYAGRGKIDVSGDGRNNCGEYPQPVRDRAVADGVTINGLAILNEDPYLTNFYQRSVIGGPGAFVLSATDYESFAEAMRRKLLRELAPGHGGTRALL